MSDTKPQVALTSEQLMELIKEIRKPVVTEKEQKELEAAQQTRRENAELMKHQAAMKLAQQKSCGHMRRDGSTRAVYVENGNYMICQKCQSIIRPEHPDFNRLFQLCNDSGLFG